MPDPSIPASQLATPALLVDRDRLEANLERMKTRADELDVALRPHIKTAKTVPVAEEASPSGALTVSTLAEAEHFHAHGFDDLTYAVAIAPDKIERTSDLRADGVDLTLLVDTPTAARAVADQGSSPDEAIPVLIEVDCDGTRGGIAPDEPLLQYVAEILAEGEGAGLEGVLTHAGSAYDARGEKELVEAAERERDAVVEAAQKLRGQGHEVPTVSVGSTPTALAAEDLRGVTEMRPGNYVFFDLYQAGLGVCTVEDIALTVLAQVIGHRDRDGCPIVDAGSLALSEDRSTSAFGDERDRAYGLVADLHGEPLSDGDVLVAETSQEHGILDRRGGEPPQLVIGERVRVYPNHACITAACYEEYQVATDREVVDTWERVNGW